MTVSNAFEAVVPASTQSEGAGGRARVRARVASTQSNHKILVWVRSVGSTVVSDVTQAWPIRSHAPSPYDLWQNRIPALDRVPGENRPLWVAWIAFNHVALVAGVALSLPLWLLGHPARTLLAAAVTAPLFAIWLI